MQLDDLKKITIPDAPGVYVFMRGKKILYIGKATSLKDRTRSYFSNDLIKTRGPLLVDMITTADRIEVTQTDSVLEALILEASLIKKHQPVYNTKEKDNKSYSFVCITKERFPRVVIERGRTLSFDATPFQAVYGPFPSQSQLREALNMIRKIFPFRTDATDARLYTQLGLSPDITDAHAYQKYKTTIRHIKLFFQGKKKTVITQLEKQMHVHAKNQEFEHAARIRNQIFALQHLRDVSLIKREHVSVAGDVRIEAFDVAHLGGAHAVGVMTVIEDGEVQKSQYRKFILRNTKRGDDVGGLEEILTRRLAHTEWPLPRLFIVDGGVAQRNRALRILADAGIEIPVIGVVKNDAHKPERLLGPKEQIAMYEKEILLANSEAHRYAISFYRTRQRKKLRS